MKGRQWTPAQIAEWQQFYRESPRFSFGGRTNDFSWITLPSIPKYADLNVTRCGKQLDDSTPDPMKISSDGQSVAGETSINLLFSLIASMIPLIFLK